MVMRRRLAARVLLLGFFLFFIGSVFAQEKGAPAPGELPEVRYETVDGQTITGKLIAPRLRLRTEFGVQEIDAPHIRRVQFRPAGDTDVLDTVEITDSTIFHGRLEEDSIEI